MMIELNTWVVGVLTLLVSWLWWKRRAMEQKDYDPYAIEPCPNPDCIRCRKYAEVNSAAQDRLNAMEIKPERIIQALKHGRRGGDIRREDEMSPAIGQYPTVLLVPGLSARPIVTDMHHQCCDAIKQHASTILKEYLEANEYASWLQNDVVVQNDASSWNVLHLVNQGVWNEENAALCPETTKVVQSLVIMDGCIFGNVFLSVLTPGASIEPHCGPTNARHRLHLALQIPSCENNDKEPVLTVLEEHITWKEGEVFVFDDSLTHAVDYPESSSSLKPRVVLIIDVWHPGLTEAERKAIQELYPMT